MGDDSVDETVEQPDTRIMNETENQKTLQERVRELRLAASLAATSELETKFLARMGDLAPQLADALDAAEAKLDAAPHHPGCLVLIRPHDKPDCDCWKASRLFHSQTAMTTDATTPEQPEEQPLVLDDATAEATAKAIRATRINPASDNPDCVKQNADGLQQTIESLRAQLEEAKNRSKAWETVYDKEWKETCVHHTDSERAFSGCPVCNRKQLDTALARVADLEKGLREVSADLDHIFSGKDDVDDGQPNDAARALMISARITNLLKP